MGGGGSAGAGFWVETSSGQVRRGGFGIGDLGLDGRTERERERGRGRAGYGLARKWEKTFLWILYKSIKQECVFGKTGHTKSKACGHSHHFILLPYSSLLPISSPTDHPPDLQLLL